MKPAYPEGILPKSDQVITENLYPVSFYLIRGNQYGYINQASELVIPPRYYWAGDFSEGLAPVKFDADGKWGFIDLQGKIRIAPQYDMVGESSSDGAINDKYNVPSSSFSDGLSAVKLNGKWGFIDRQGKLIIPFQFEEVRQFVGQVASVRVNNRWGVIDSRGNWIITAQYPEPISINFYQGIADLYLALDTSDRLNKGILVYINKSGKILGTARPPSLAEEFQEGMAIIEKWGNRPPNALTSESSWSTNCGFQDALGNVIIKPRFYNCKNFSEGLAAVRVGDKWGYIDRRSEFIVEPRFDYADRHIEERALIVVNGKIGFIDTTGKVVVKPEFDPIGDSNTTYESSIRENKYLRWQFQKYPGQLEAREIEKYRFSNGLAVAAKGDRCGYIDSDGQFIIPPEYLGCERFDSHGIARLQRKTSDPPVEGRVSTNEDLYIDRTGKTIPRRVYLPDPYPPKIKLFILSFALPLWIVAISFHEFAHAIVAYRGGDRSVKAKGYLSFNPLRYLNIFHSILVPGFFLLIGGIPLPGAAVYIDMGKLRNRRWISFMAAAGPLASALFGLLLVPVFHASRAWNCPDWLAAAIATFISLQFFTALFNLLPVPPLDGYRMISVWLPSKLKDKEGTASLIGLFLLCFVLPFFPVALAPIFLGTSLATYFLGIPESFALDGWSLFDRWIILFYILIAGLIYSIFHPETIFQVTGFLLEKFSRDRAIENYERAIEINPDSAWSWERLAITLDWNSPSFSYYSIEVARAYERAVQLNPYNRYPLMMLILQLNTAVSFDPSCWQKLISAVEKYTEYYPEDPWGWSEKAKIEKRLETKRDTG